MRYTASQKLKILASHFPKIPPKRIASELRKIAAEVEKEDEEETESEIMKEYRTKIFDKMKKKESFGKLKLFLDNPRLRKPTLWWLNQLDDGAGAGTMEYPEFLKKMKQLIQRDWPAAKPLRLILDWAMEKGWMKLNTVLTNGMLKTTLQKELSK